MCFESSAPFFPIKVKEPEVGVDKPQIILRIVVLPAPFLPISPYTSPFFIWILI
jgi:hypothetical protein